MKDKSILMALVVGVIAGAILTDLASGSGTHKTQSQLMSEYYQVENAVSVSPTDVKTALQRGSYGEFVLVDLRSQVEYEEEHITSAINVPIFVDPEVSGISNEERIVKAFAEIKKNNPEREIIMYCYSGACMASRKAGKILSEHNIFAKHLNIGWYEWRYFWKMWSGEDGLNVEDFITKGAEAGEPNLEMKDKIIAPCSEDAEFGC